MTSVDLNRVPSFYHGYIHTVHEMDLPRAFEAHQLELIGLLENLPEEKWNHRYAPDKWTIKELVQHIIDAERIFCYRALCFARKDKTPLPGFDENSYAVASGADRRSGNEFVEELSVVQKASVLLFASFNEEQLEETGISNGHPVYVKALGFIVVGHARHHARILEERYLQKTAVQF